MPASATDLQALAASAVEKWRGGHFVEADALSARLIAAAPDNPAYLRLRATILFQASKVTDAVATMARLVRSAPRDASLLSDYGYMLQVGGDTAGAIAALEEAVTLAPDNFAARVNLGNVHYAIGQAGPAEQQYLVALQLKPGFAPALNNLAELQYRRGRATESLATADALVVAAPQAAMGHHRRADALDLLGRRAEAMLAFERAVQCEPDNLIIALAQANSFAANGDLGRAEAICRDMLRRSPGHAGALVDLTRYASLASDYAVVESMRLALADPASSEKDRVALGFALGKVLEDGGDYPAAFACFADAAARQRRQITYSSAATEQVFDSLIAAFTPKRVTRLSGLGSDSAMPIFVVGMPRSGTTLVEQILASHEQVSGAGELSELSLQVAELVRAKGADSMAQVLDRADGPALQRFGEAYLGQLASYARGSRYVVDKMPANFLHIGLIRLALPKARIIHCRRDALDTSLSIFKTNFGEGAQPQSYDLGELGHYYRQYQRLMAHWSDLFGPAIYHIDYEKLVRDPEGQSRLLLAHCGLDWSPAPIAFQQAGSVVRTASIFQVRQPVHTRSIGLAESYGALLDPLRRALAGS